MSVECVGDLVELLSGFNKTDRLVFNCNIEGGRGVEYCGEGDVSINKIEDGYSYYNEEEEVEVDKGVVVLISVSGERTSCE